MLLADLRHRRRNVLAPVITIALGITLLIVIQTLFKSFTVLSEKPLEMIASDITVQRSGNVPEEMKGALFPCSAVTIKKSEIESAGSISGIISINKAILLWVFDPGGFKNVLGIESSTQEGASVIKNHLTEGRFFEDLKYEAVADKSYADNNGIKTGSKIKIAGVSFMITGLVSSEKTAKMIMANYYIPFQAASEIAVKSKGIQSILPFAGGDATILFIRTKQGSIQKVENQLKEILGDKITISSPSVFLDKFRGIIKFFIDFSYVFMGFVIAVTFLITILSIFSNLNQKKHEIGILKAIGWSPSEVTGLLIKETIIICFIGSLLGILTALAVNYFIRSFTVDIIIPWETGSSIPHFMMKNPDEKNILSFNLPVSPQWLLSFISLIGACITGVVIGYFSGIKANKIKPVEAVKHE